MNALLSCGPYLRFPVRDACTGGPDPEGNWEVPSARPERLDMRLLQTPPV
jgi:hypothetical protein